MYAIIKQVYPNLRHIERKEIVNQLHAHGVNRASSKQIIRDYIEGRNPKDRITDTNDRFMRLTLADIARHFNWKIVVENTGTSEM